jgi:hypothetical protein
MIVYPAKAKRYYFSTEREIQMRITTFSKLNLGLITLVAAFLVVPFAGSADDASDAVADALSAAWPGMAENATVVDWDGNVLKEGSNGYTCMPSPPTAGGPMCMDDEWLKWADAWQNKTAYTAETIGISYMLAGDGNGGGSNIDPYAEGPTDDNEWIVEGPHLMILGPAALLDAIPTDPQNGGPYVMWKGTPYAHVMVPIGSRD